MTRQRYIKLKPGPGKVWLPTLEKCLCGGYYFPHRKGSGACLHSPVADYYRAVAQGMNPLEALELVPADKLQRVHPLSESD